MKPHEAAENWINGNRSDVLAEVCDTSRGGPARVALFALDVYHALEAWHVDYARDFHRAIARRS